MSKEKEDKRLFGKIYKQLNSKFYRCFWPQEQCFNRPINAHSVQNSRVLDILSENNHVIVPKCHIDIETGIFVEFEKESKYQATTFTGLCKVHDNKLFEPIDNYKVDPENEEQLFLLAYRSVLRKLHVKMKAAVDLHEQYERCVDSGRFNPEIVDQPMNLVVNNLSEAYSFYRYKFMFDQIYLQKDFEKVNHRLCFIENMKPSIAVSSVYSHIDNMKTCQNRQDPKCITLNVFPSDNGVYIIFSYRKDQEKKLKSHIENIFQAKDHYRLYLVSKLILMYCENIVISPEFYRNLSKKSKMEIVEFFNENIAGEKKNRDSKNIYLFR